MYEQVLNEVAKEYEDKINFYEINIEQEPEISSLFQVRSIPTTAFITKSGTPVVETGVLDKHTLEYYLNGSLR